MNNFIKRINVFKELNSYTQKLLLSNATMKIYCKNEVLYQEFTKCNKIYFLLKGKVSIIKNSEMGERKVIFILKDGDMLNEIGTNVEVVRCEAFERCVVIEYEREEFLDIMEKDFELTQKILEATSIRCKRLYRQLKNTRSITLDKKICSKLYRIAREFGIKKDDWTVININISITYLADMIGAKRESVSRHMSMLQDMNMIRYQNKKIYVKEEMLLNYYKTFKK